MTETLTFKENIIILDFKVFRTLLNFGIIMDSTTEKLINKVFDLPPQMRAFIAEKLIESLDKEHDYEISEEWMCEIKRRCKEIDEGSTTLVDAEEVFVKAFKKL